VNAGLNCTWSVTNGTILSGQGTNSIEVDWNTIGQGILEVAVTDSGCTQSVSKNVVLIDPTGIENNALPGIELYPNPTTGTITIRAANIQTQGTLILYNAIGGIVIQDSYEPERFQSDITIDLNELNDGVYFLNVKTMNASVILKVIKIERR